MNLHNLPDFIVFSILLIIVAVFVVMLMIRYDFLFKDNRKWFIGAALGLGVIAFSIKIAMIMLFSSKPGVYKAISVTTTQTLEVSSLPTQNMEMAGNKHVLEKPPAPDIASWYQSGYTWEALPEQAPTPEDNPQTPAKIALGKQLFFDRQLSANGSVSCASCHELSAGKGGSDGLPTSTGIHGQEGPRNAPTVINAAFQRVLFWDGRAASLEEQAQGPFLNPKEMGMASLETVQERVRQQPAYRPLFQAAFGNGEVITPENIVKAIASYERTLITVDTPYDRFVRGERSALTEQQIQGMLLFESTGCILCHSGPNFSGASLFQKEAAFRPFPVFSNKSYEKKYNLTEDRGLAEHDTSVGERGVWRVPSLRNVSRTAPYFHNGSVQDLKEAIRIMATVQLDKKVIEHPDRSFHNKQHYSWLPNEKRFWLKSGDTLSEQDIESIAAFLEALTEPVIDSEPANRRNK